MGRINQGRASSSDIDHQETTNRTHDGDTITPEALEATGSITDPEGNTVTSLSDPMRVTEDAVTFAESDLTVTQTGTVIKNGSIKLPKKTLLSDFESGDTTVDNVNYNDWDGSTADLTAQQSTVLSGDYSAEFRVNDSFNSVSLERTSSAKLNKVKLLVQIASDTGVRGDKFQVNLNSSNGTFAYLQFEDNERDIESASGDASQTWEPATTYKVEFTNIDFVNETYDVILDGTTIFSDVSFQNPASDFDQIIIDNITGNSGNERSVLFDDVQIDEEGGLTGSALITWDSGTPADIESWDLATFQRTLDDETVTIDVKDSNGNVLKSDISKDTDISDIATSTDVQLRANLSRNDKTNNPTVDYLARRFTRS